MNVKILFLLLISQAITGYVSAQFVPPPANVDTVYIPGTTMTGSNVDTIYIPGGSMKGGENAGSMESIINGDTLLSGGRINPNRVYALYEGEVYYQVAPINLYNPAGTLTITGTSKRDPDYTKTTGLTQGTTKPVILIQPTSGIPVQINGTGVNKIYGSINLENLHYQAMQMDGTIQNELFLCGTANKLPQSLTIDNCLFEFCNLALFDCTNESGNIGGWPNGAKFRITNSYFRNLFNPAQWWGSGIFSCKHPIDSLWVENCTVTTGGLTFLQKNALTKFIYINHNTIINNTKYWLQSPYYLFYIITNNIFVNQNWTGEDTNVVSTGQDPDDQFMSTINIDTIDAYHHVAVQQQYYASADSSSYTSACNLANIVVFVSDNINFDDPALTSGYYTNSTYTKTGNFTDGYMTALPSYINWNYGAPLFAIGNIPGEFLNARSAQIVANNSPAKGGQMVIQNTTTSNTALSGPYFTLSTAVVNAMAQWNQYQYHDIYFSNPGNITGSKFICGDYLPATLPGLVNGKPSDTVTGEGTGIQVGITKFTDLTENFWQTAVISRIDQLPVGAVIWNDAAFAAYSSAADWKLVVTAGKASGMGGPILESIKDVNNLPYKYSLDQNYPNPFNPGTNINFSLEKPSKVSLAVYNILGQKVATLVNKYMQAGSYNYQFSAEKLASGVYIYRIETGSFTASKKMIVLK